MKALALALTLAFALAGWADASDGNLAAMMR